MSDRHEAERDDFAGRLFEAALGFFDVLSVYLGDRLGLYRALADAGPSTPSELAALAGIHERYAREWLEQQAATGILAAESAGEGHRFSLPAGHAEVLLDATSLSYLAPLARMQVSVTRPLEALLDGYRTGGGVEWSAFGADARDGQSDMNRPIFDKLLCTVWLPAIRDVHARLSSAQPPARIAEVGCGGGWACIAMARAFPSVRVDGFDIDEPSIELARRNAAEAGLDGRVRFEAGDAADLSARGEYDLVAAFECIHDMSNPVEVLATMRGMAGEGGTVLVVDERTEDEFSAPAGPAERFFYGWSILCCLPAGMADQPSAATGTVMRTGTLLEYAKQAGYADLDVLPIEHEMFRLYRLTP